jgi:hypothetical protein
MSQQVLSLKDLKMEELIKHASSCPLVWEGELVLGMASQTE